MPASLRPPPALPAPVDGDTVAIQLPGFGRVAAFMAGQGAPLLLVHSVNAAASAAEVRPVHQHFLRSRTVLSVDLPGYGLSDRPDIAYTPRLMNRRRAGGSRAAAPALRRCAGGRVGAVAGL